MTEDQFLEIVTDSVEHHISRDTTISEEDQKWETRNLAKKLAYRIRMYFPDFPVVTDEKGQTTE